MTIGWKTLDVNEQALVYNVQGEARVEEGPCRLFLFREKLQMMSRHSANQTEYLRIKYRDGHMEHKPGPCVVYFNRLEMKSVQCVKGVSLDANEVLVVYELDSKSSEVSRQLRHGPSIYIPAANQWLHNFGWHGTDPNNKTRKLPGLLNFTKLQLIPDQFYYNVDEVRTADDALIRVKLMIFYELTDIEKMLNTTQDPIADFINCTAADVIMFTSKLTYMEFIEKSGQLNDLVNYPQLLERCKVIGYDIHKVVFRGYHASPKLQAMHDSAIQKRTELKIAYECEEQSQALTDVRLQNDMQRTTLEQEMELSALHHQHQLHSSKEDHKLKMKKQEAAEKARNMQKQETASIQSQKLMDSEKVKLYSQLGDLGVDLTRYILHQNPTPNKVVKVVTHQGAANFHIHQSTAV